MRNIEEILEEAKKDMELKEKELNEAKDVFNIQRSSVIERDCHASTHEKVTAKLDISADRIFSFRPEK